MRTHSPVSLDEVLEGQRPGKSGGWLELFACGDLEQTKGISWLLFLPLQGKLRWTHVSKTSASRCEEVFG